MRETLEGLREIVESIRGWKPQDVFDLIDWHYGDYIDLYPGYSDEEDTYEEGDDYYYQSKEVAYREAEFFIDIFRELYRKRNITVYRAIYARSVDSIRFDNPGESWTWERDKAVQFGSHNGSNFILVRERLFGLDVETTSNYLERGSLRTVQIYDPATDRTSVFIRRNGNFEKVIYYFKDDIVSRTSQEIECERLVKLLNSGWFITHNGLFDSYILCRDLAADVTIVGDSFVFGSLVPYSKADFSRSLENMMQHEVDSGYQKGAWEEHNWEGDLSDDAIRYGARDAKAAYLLEHAVRARLPLYNNKVYQLELDVIPVLARMRDRGIWLREERFEEAVKSFTERAAGVSEEINKEAGRKINVKSSKQLGEWLFEDRGNEPISYTAKGAPSVSEDVLKKLSDPVVEKVLEAVHLRGVLSSVKNLKLKNYYEERDGCLVFYPEFKPLSMSYGGRIYTNNPSINQLPWELRYSVVPSKKDSLFYYADVSAFEFMILAYSANEVGLIEAYKEGRDIHKMIASEMFGLKEKEVTEDMRETSKTVEYAIVYGSQGSSVARKLGISLSEARGYIDSFYDRFSGIIDFKNQLVEEAQKKRVVWTRMGRCRRLYGDDVDMIERKAFNFYAQSGSADIMKRALVFLERTLPEGCRLSFTVFDSFLIEIDDISLKGQVDRLIRDALIYEGWEFNFESGTGTSWYDAKKNSFSNKTLFK